MSHVALIGRRIHPFSRVSSFCIRSGTDLFGDVEVEHHHAEVVDYESPPQRVGLAVLHVSRPRPQEEQVQAADGQCGAGR